MSEYVSQLTFLKTHRLPYLPPVNAFIILNIEKSIFLHVESRTSCKQKVELLARRKWNFLQVESQASCKQKVKLLASRKSNFLQVPRKSNFLLVEIQTSCKQKFKLLAFLQLFPSSGLDCIICQTLLYTLLKINRVEKGQKTPPCTPPHLNFQKTSEDRAIFYVQC